MNTEPKTFIARATNAGESSSASAIAEALQSYGLDGSGMPLPAIIALFTTFQLGMVVERLSGVEAGHAELLASIQHWLDDLESQGR